VALRDAPFKLHSQRITGAFIRVPARLFVVLQQEAESNAEELELRT
jgi:hypothetical protein